MPDSALLSESGEDVPNEARRKSPGGYANGRATREDVLHRAAAAFAEQGYHGASLRAIARSAGIDHSTLLHHFGDKTSLLLAVLAWRDEEAMRFVSADWVSAEDLRAQMAALVEHNRSIPGLVQLYAVLSAEAATEGHPARAFFQERAEQLATQFEDAIRRFGTGPIPADLHARVLTYLALWEGLQVFDAVNPGRLDIGVVLDGELGRLLGT
ncbi:TetR/AcrR family transcriptional regulator [Leifsonia sp. TF02-11]|uniref:TetR/AcrR family transcriptional regulator n=1 Tax=Leifsonia sp. TF02-11 TaxID=2815212 RepID=UPI001AA10C38|nr:TetR/AcrR family transcriptional regulator [Leifsonia sp. TF02-11]MBO1741397.1 TetR/AcrR family transcriptional regulator [Leifsonia sp. TF02-11]